MLEGKTAIITGAARGIGKATAELFAENQIKTIYAVDILGDVVENTAKMISSQSDTEVIPIVLDVTDSNGRREFIKRLIRDKIRIDILINDAGVALSALIEMSSEKDIRHCFDVSALGTIGFIQDTIRLMKRNTLINGSRGSIVNISSIAGTKGNRGQIAYSGAKAAVVGITTSASKELAPFQIRVNAVAPGIIETDMLHTLSDEIIAEMITHVGLGRVGNPRDIANALLFFADEEKSGYCTGQVLNVDGGYIM